METYTVYLPGTDEDRFLTFEIPPVSGDLIALDDGEQVRVVEVVEDRDGGWIVFAGPADPELA
jgi:hypothetical protein